MHYACRNMTMAAFADGLRTMNGVLVGTPVLDQTGLKGQWNFDVKWSLPVVAPMASGERVSAAEALEKELGLKLEQVPVPKPVLVVDSVERKPSANPPGVKEALTDIPAPTEFEVADVKLDGPNAGTGRISGTRMQPGGRYVAEGVTLALLVRNAFDTGRPTLAGMPDWATSVRVAITAKVPSDYPAGQRFDSEIIAPMLRSLLAERFGLVWHSEERMLPAYSLVAAKPKLKKADPESRTYCRILPPGPNTTPGEQVLSCQNATMAIFAERLRGIASDINSVEDATGLAGGWDFALTFNPFPAAMLSGPRRSDAGQDGPVASDPGGGTTIFQAVEKQLGLKLEAKKRMLPVIVIDKLNQKPTDN
jgi:uncharacterized protein (TIGR03435 family)